SSPASFKTITRDHVYSARLGYTIYDFGRQSAKELAASESLKAQELASEEVDEELFWSVLRAYQAVVAAERIVAIVKEQLSISEEKLREQRKNYNQGLRPESDVVTAEVDVGRAKLAYQEAWNDALIAKQELISLINPESPAELSRANELSVSTSGLATTGPE